MKLRRNWRREKTLEMKWGLHQTQKRKENAKKGFKVPEMMRRREKRGVVKEAAKDLLLPRAKKMLLLEARSS